MSKNCPEKFENNNQKGESKQLFIRILKYSVTPVFLLAILGFFLNEENPYHHTLAGKYWFIHITTFNVHIISDATEYYKNPQNLSLLINNFFFTNLQSKISVYTKPNIINFTYEVISNRTDLVKIADVYKINLKEKENIELFVAFSTPPDFMGSFEICAKVEESAKSRNFDINCKKFIKIE